MRKEKINNLEDKIRELTGNLEKSHLSHASAYATLHQTKIEYGKVFE